MTQPIEVREGIGWGIAALSMSVISILILITTLFCVKNTTSNGLFGPSVAPVIFGFAGFAIMVLVNLMGILFSLLQWRRNGIAVGGIGLGLNLLIPFVVYAWFTSQLH